MDTDRDLIHGAFTLFDRERIGRPIRLIGYGVHNLITPEQAAPVQPDLFADTFAAPVDRRNKKLDQAVDSLRKTFGSHALKRGAPSRSVG